MPAKGATESRRVRVPTTMTTLPPPDGPPTEALVFAGGDALAPRDHARLREALAVAGRGTPLIIAADSGLHEAQAGGWATDLVIGDLDSVDPARLQVAEEAGARVDRYPAAKAATDLELALDAAVAAGAERIVVVGGHGGRVDHFLANLLLLGSDRFASSSISALLGPAWVHLVRRTATWHGARGDLVTLLALHGAVTGVTTSGLLYPLDHATLHAGSTRGVSNEQLDMSAGVAVEAGVLAVVLPGESGVHVLAADEGSLP
jgi:thiamine pyrophosphokinase